jgi:hypothetical protein
MIGVREEVGNHLTPAQIAQQVLGIVFGLKVPFLAFPVLMTELAHVYIPPNRLAFYYTKPEHARIILLG